MPVLELTFASKEDSLSVRHFAIREEMSALFEVTVVARSELEDIDLESIVGKGATFKIVSGVAHAATGSRVWTGICSHMEQIQAETTGLSTYLVKIVPALWRTTLRRNNRIFQHLSIPEIVTRVLTEWQIEPELRIDAGQYPKFEYRVQYNETDFAFLNRLLEEAGIAYYTSHGETTEQGKPPATKLVLADTPQANEMRAGGPLPFVDNPNQEAEKEFVTNVRLVQNVRPGRVTLRDFDFRNRLDYQLYAESRSGSATEDAYEHYHYAPGAFLVEPGRAGDTPVADDKGIARVNEREGQKLATRALEGERRGRRSVAFKTNVLDLSPGTMMQIGNHPRKDLVDKNLLVVACTLEGAPGEDWTIRGESVFADIPYRPERRTARPRIYGVQSAVVVGPQGEEIHTDEFGRVRVQFHWDREGRYDDNSSCWMRVSQAWAGSSYGLIAIPRVGQEVLVEFFDGDPDRPVITGRVFNNTRRIPYKLPENKTKSGWKSDTSPGANGYNELSFEDAKGREAIHIQAQKDFTEVVKNNQTSTVLASRSADVTSNDSVTVGVSQTFNVGDTQSHTIGKAQSNNIGMSRTSTIGESDVVNVGKSMSATVGPGVGYVIKDDRSIIVTTGEASITISPGGVMSINAKGDLIITADGILKLSGKRVEIDGAPDVYVNCTQKAATVVPVFDKAKEPSKPRKPGSGGEGSSPSDPLSGQGTVEEPGGFEEATVNELVVTPRPTPQQAPTILTLGSRTAQQIAQRVTSVLPAANAGQASRSLLIRDSLKHGLELAKTVKDAADTKGKSLLQLPEVKGAVGEVLMQPVLGEVTGKDIADLVKQGQQVGIFHLGKKENATLEYLTKAGEEGTKNAQSTAGAGAGAGAGARAGAAAVAPGPGATTEGSQPRADADPLPFAESLDAAGIEQFMVLRTEAAPPAIDGEALTTDIGAHRAAGLSFPQAHADALEKHGLAFYQGDGEGTFLKVVPTKFQRFP